MPGGANRYAVLVNDTLREYPVAIVLFIQGNDRIDIPFVQEFVSSVIVAGTVGNKCIHRKVCVDVPELGEGYNSGDAVMSLGINNTQEKWQVKFLLTVVR
jgi:hypothetical protein